MNEINTTKFVILTRGRTGSTAIVDEINKHPDITCLQELFISLDSDPMLKGLYDKFGVDFDRYGLRKWFPTFELWLKQVKMFKVFSLKIYLYKGRLLTSSKIIKAYIQEVESYTAGLDGRVMGFKLLGHQVPNLPRFLSAMKKLEYKIIYLERKNVVRQVLSGVIANKRKVYNQRNYMSDNKSFTIDLKEFKFLVNMELAAVEEEKAMLESSGIAYLNVNYEDFLSNRKDFFSPVFQFLDVDNMVPEKSTFSIMITDAKDVIENYSEFTDCLREIGLLKYVEN